MKNTEIEKRKIREEFKDRVESEVKLAKTRCFAEADRMRPLGSTNAEKPLIQHIGELMLEKSDRLLETENKITRPEGDMKKLLNIIIAEEVRKAGMEMINVRPKPAP